jgi:hypothetical protein
MLRLTIDEADHWGDANVGTPKAYAEIGRQLRFIPAPSGNFTVKHRFVRTEVSLGSDSSEPLCPEPWIEAVILAVGVLCYQRTGELEQLGAVKAEYDAAIEHLGGRASQNADTTGGGAVPIKE